MIDSLLNPKGEVEINIDYLDGKKESWVVKNTILSKGKQAIAKALTNQFQGDFNLYITRMIFGDGGTQGGSPRYIYTDRNGLFGLTVLSKPVIASTDPALPQQAIFTSVVRLDDAVGQTINEMALQLANEDVFCMTTFADLTKTSQMQITFNWKISFV